MAQLDIKNTGARTALVIPGETIRGWVSTVCTSSSEIADADCSCALRSICCAVSREKTSAPQPYKDQRHLKRKTYEKFLAFIYFENFKFPSSSSFSSAIQVRIKFETKQWHLFFPFSGQKFAMLEMKSTISQVLRSFKVIESDSKEDLRFTNDFILKSANGLKVKVGLR